MLSTIGQTIFYGWKSIRDPTRQDAVAAVGELTAVFPGINTLSHLRNKMLLSHSGRKLLREKPLISSTSLHLDNLSNLPEESFGRQYLKFLNQEKVTPDSRTPVKFIKDDELAYVMLRYRQTHDFLHTLTGIDTTLTGEIALKWFEFCQTGLPMNLLAATFGPLRLLKTWKFQDPHDRNDNDLQTKINWAIKCGSNAEFLLQVPFEELLGKDLTELRKELCIIPFTPDIK